MHQGWTPDVGVTNEVKARFDSALASYRANPHLVEEHANHEESIRVGGYANRTLLELVQNAADAMADGGASETSLRGRVKLVLDQDRKVLYCANSGRPFSAEGIRSITHAHLSGKRGDEIGRFGLGFKSVLAVSDSPVVYSRTASFQFNSSEARAALQNLGTNAKRFPVLRTATVVDAEVAIANDPVLDDLSTWASTVVVLPNASNLERLTKEMEEFRSEFLLFVGAVREVELQVIGASGFTTSHVSKDLGGGNLRIEQPSGDGTDWLIASRMHSPSAASRAEVGEAVSRSSVKVTVAVPQRHSKLRIGQFWSYFPLQDETSASALFNAPWSINDDRTTLLRNDYNREILATMASMLVDILPQLSTPGDRAAHLDYLPARGRETLSFGDYVLCNIVPSLTADQSLIPNATGILTSAGELRPLDFGIDKVSMDQHEAWISSPNTGDDVPHWRCYSTDQRRSRLRDIFIASMQEWSSQAISDRDAKRALETLPKRTLLAWLREWADGPDLASSVAAFRFATKHPGFPNIDKAAVIPTTRGLRSLSDRYKVFLGQDDIDFEDSIFVTPAFLAEPGVERALENAGFGKLDPVAVLRARSVALDHRADDEEWSRLWTAVLDVSPRNAIPVLAGHPGGIKVPTLDGGWAWPRQVFDPETHLSERFAGSLLDARRCLPEVAHGLGVLRSPKREVAIEDEPCFNDYRTWVLETLNGDLKPGERPIANIEFDHAEGPGPFSMLLMLEDAQAPVAERARWTEQLLTFGDVPWTVEDRDTEKAYRIASPLRWAVDRAGLVSSTRGYRRPADVVAPSMVLYADLLPLFRGPRPVVDALDLPDELGRVPHTILREALEGDFFPSKISDSLLVEFISTISRIAYDEGRPVKIPARVRKSIEAFPPSSVFLATDDEQANYLSTRQRPYLTVTEEQAEVLVQYTGCRRFEDSFSFSMLVEEQQEGVSVLDRFPGLRSIHVADVLTDATVAGAARIIKRVTTKEGTEDQPSPWHREGVTLFVPSDANEMSVLSLINEAFELKLSKTDLDHVVQAGQNHKIELTRQQALAASTHAERLEVFFGDEDLKEILPPGLWSALEAQGLVDARTSVAELFLTVFGADSVKMLRDRFTEFGFSDVPDKWAGQAPTVDWLRKVGFGPEFAGLRIVPQEQEFVVPGAVKLNPLHPFQLKLSQRLRGVLTLVERDGRAQKAMVELPTGAGKTRVATQTVLELFIQGKLQGPVLWIAQSKELCEQAVQTWSTVWRGLGDERPLTIGRLWDTNTVHQPDTEFSVVVATDAKLLSIVTNSQDEYRWLSEPSVVIVDEGHRAGDSTMYTEILEWLGIAGYGWKRPLVGLTATPFKGTSESATKALASRFGGLKLDVFEGNAYQHLSDLGVLARVRHKVLGGTSVTLSPAEADQARRNQISGSVLGRIGKSQERLKVLVEHIMSLDPTWPVLVFTPDVLSSQVLAATLRYRKVKAESVSGQTGRQARNQIISKFKAGDIQVLTNCDLLIQGFDAPSVRALYIARPTFSPNAYIQMAGRGLRGPENGGKEECLIVDMNDDLGDFTQNLSYREYEKLWGQTS